MSSPAGSYPAFYLSSFQPIQVLKDNRGNRRLRPRKEGGTILRRRSIAAGFKSSWLRSTLVVFQFTISIALIIGTLVIYRQLNYIRSRSTGYNRDQVLIIQALYRPGDGTKAAAYHILGVVKDFNYSSMHDKVRPAVINLADYRKNIAVRLKPGSIPSMVHQIEAKWQHMAPGLPFTYTFMDNSRGRGQSGAESTIGVSRERPE